ncbi:uncharacterized protein STEHIDRAFT_168667 [Stereum hirsutum FP-91666 SS1]|uniref:uncharacterized protein n=1 Tax=Stereum hirsutum (strain FP-91666) TaxID=721885 RepID=UPI000440EF87|nr:uncharacterized protein STEHIDRAFT_168667 [Stereum hirsutum FP-91666 SS1]EIM86741.1 hypothetical protein STEHIDRAFT_168667 [Stereum hirsutum FP-91666 SS1]
MPLPSQPIVPPRRIIQEDNPSPYMFAIWDSVDASQAASLYERLERTVGDFRDAPTAFRMLRQILWVAYQGTAREDHGTLPGPPIRFYRDVGSGVALLGILIDDAVAGRFSLPEGHNILEPLGSSSTCVLHIWPVGQSTAHSTSQIPLQRGVGMRRRAVTTAELIQVIARRVYDYFRYHEVIVRGRGRITTNRLCLVGLTWISQGAVIPILQIDDRI